jgi:hypothetical protein
MSLDHVIRIIPIPGTVPPTPRHQPVADPTAAILALAELADLLLSHPITDAEAQHYAESVSRAAYRLQHALDWTYDATPIEIDLMDHVYLVCRADVRIHIEQKVGAMPAMLYRYAVDRPLRTLIGIARGLGLDRIGGEHV